MINNPAAVVRRRGRPIAFDRDQVLALAAEVFWRLGYEGASMPELSAAMGITVQSLYAAFRSKAELYQQALAHYQRSTGAFAERALREEADVVEGFLRLLREAAHEYSLPGRPRGCMISTATLTCAVENEGIREFVSTLRANTLKAFEAHIEQGIASGQLRADTQAVALARYIGAIIQGMSVQAQDGADCETLLAIGELAGREIERARA
ncbi:TetR/AcrR family transcriptional regulator [Pseudomonas chlororaphis]|uniref:TetR/AcrR family transcriptional regulator n=1 Tax=Pseudomonas chlororaphis TaxID=587753 RepID=UPI0007B3D1B5|nr:TetR/AcrR family transcriptional regulator [Pseudomonas chlororaphis]AZC50940.1 Transcriptional regulator, AcrR family [Pseudomonas chlororaphis subsp. piscium]AZC57512.1 Transcriptional regulator, AcrR family [Pseudomonas chlororaphis subsp. piscium]AZC63738.1 Transcriptional regulator, AcrR family [Pseudomonas chlororaphis subsp. piscium]AZC69976.1 Transcriptional regulator, AcrR family [Pseudomonas chlororaphis subsp. piscium]AZC76218.1 Transcriptional regulator, AcrR family [Pseudomonas